VARACYEPGVLGPILLVSLLADAAVRYTGSAVAEDAKKERGTQVVREISADVDGDGVEEIVVVERDKDKTMRVRVLRSGGDVEEPTFTAIAASTPRKADRLLRIEAKELTGKKGLEVIAVLEESSPDETVQHVRILGATVAGIGELFAQSFFVPRGQEKDPALVELGDAAPRFAIRDRGQGLADLAWVRGPQVLAFPIGKAPATAVIGGYEQIYRYQSGKGVFEADPQPTVVDYLPPRAAWTVEASAQVPKIWGTAQPFWGSDGDLATAWTVAGPKAGAGEWLQVSFKGNEDVQLLRVVPGCAASAQAWAEHDRVRAFTVELSSGVRFDLDRAAWAKTNDIELPRAIRAVGDFPIKDELGAEIGRQILILLRDKQPIRSARFVVGQLEPGKPGRGIAREACVAEISVH